MNAAPSQSIASASITTQHLTSGRLLAGNTRWNLIGMCAPLLVAVVCLPVLKNALGADRLGIITLSWAVVGYFGLFDFGLSRALTQLIAEKLGKSQQHEIPALVWTSIALMAAIGVMGSVVTLACAPWLVRQVIKVPAGLQQESLYAFYWVSASIPFVIVTAGFRGVLEALQRFRLATLIRVPSSVFTYAGPLLVLPFSHSLAAILAVLVIGRVLAGVAHLWACGYALPELRHWGFSREAAGALLRFGSWTTISNVVGPMMVTFDRFVIGAVISIGAVAYYAVPAEIVTRLLMFPAALAGVLFPAFSTAHASDRGRVAVLFDSGVKLILFVMFPAMLLLAMFAGEGLNLWLGPAYAAQSANVVRYLAIAVLINAVGQVPFVHLQGAGRPDIPARLHLLELPLYAVTLLLLVKTRGIEGAALAWALRVALDALLLFVFSSRTCSGNQFTEKRLPWLMAAATLCFAATFLNIPLAGKLLLAGTVIVGFLLIGWHWMFSARERLAIRGQLRGEHAAG